MKNLNSGLATKDFVRAEFNRLDKKFTVWFMVILAIILITNPVALELVQKLLGLVK